LTPRKRGFFRARRDSGKGGEPNVKSVEEKFPPAGPKKKRLRKPRKNVGTSKSRSEFTWE